MKALLKKDIRNALAALPPALLLGIPLLLIIEFTQSPHMSERISWRSAFWLVYFFGSTSLFYRSFGFENQFKTFHIYRAFSVSPLHVFLSQTLIHFLSASLMGICYLLVTWVLWSPGDMSSTCLVMTVFASAILAPIGTTLGLMLQIEREFLFSLTFLPIATPVVLGAFSYELQQDSPWPWILAIFFVGGSFLSAFVFRFFFDDLTN